MLPAMFLNSVGQSHISIIKFSLGKANGPSEYNLSHFPALQQVNFAWEMLLRLNSEMVALGFSSVYRHNEGLPSLWNASKVKSCILSYMPAFTLIVYS